MRTRSSCTIERLAALILAIIMSACGYVIDTRELDEQDCLALHGVPSALLLRLRSSGDPNRTEQDTQISNALLLTELIAYQDCIDRVNNQTKPIYK